MSDLSDNTSEFIGCIVPFQQYILKETVITDILEVHKRLQTLLGIEKSVSLQQTTYKDALQSLHASLDLLCKADKQNEIPSIFPSIVVPEAKNLDVSMLKYAKLESWQSNPLKLINIWKENQDDPVITLFYVGALKKLKRDE